VTEGNYLQMERAPVEDFAIPNSGRRAAGGEAFEWVRMLSVQTRIEAALHFPLLPLQEAPASFLESHSCLAHATEPREITLRPEGQASDVLVYWHLLGAESHRHLLQFGCGLGSQRRPLRLRRCSDLG
jgi:hypothetical protein